MTSARRHVGVRRRGHLTKLAADGHFMVAAASRPHSIGVSAAEGHVMATGRANGGTDVSA